MHFVSCCCVLLLFPHFAYKFVQKFDMIFSKFGKQCIEQISRSTNICKVSKGEPWFLLGALKIVGLELLFARKHVPTPAPLHLCTPSSIIQWQFIQQQSFIPVPTVQVEALVSSTTKLPCQMNSTKSSDVFLVLWYVDLDGKPIYRYVTFTYKYIRTQSYIRILGQISLKSTPYFTS